MPLLRTLRRLVLRTILVILLLVAACLPVFRWPQPLFRFSVTSSKPPRSLVTSASRRSRSLWCSVEVSPRSLAT